MSTAEAWTVGRLLTWTADYLKKHGSTSPRLDAEVLLAEARGCGRIDLYTAFGEEPSEEVRASFKEMVRRRAEGTPVAYLVGRKEFYSLSFEVNPDVLIPRPETEHLVVEAIDRAKELTGQAPGSVASTQDNRTAQHNRTAQGEQPSTAQARGSADAPVNRALPVDAMGQPDTEPSGAGEWPLVPRALKSFHGLTIADVGTGSGVIAVALAKSLPGSKIIAIDQSVPALALAGRNVQQHDVAGQVSLLESNLLSAVDSTTFDIIVSNPPYISEAEYEALPVSVRSYEPRSALVAGPIGTEVIQQLLTQATGRLRAGGWLLLELSPMIADQVVALVDRQFWKEPMITKDLAGHARILSVGRL